MLSLPLGFSFLLPLPQRWCSLQLISPGVGRRPRSSSAVLPVSSLPTGPSPHSHTHTELGAARSTPRRVGAAPRHAARPSHSLQVGYLRVAAGGAELGEEGLQVPAASAQIKGRRGSGPARSRGRARRRLAAGGERGQLGDSRPGLRPPGLGDRPRPPRRPRRGANSLLSTVSKCCTRRRDRVLGVLWSLRRWRNGGQKAEVVSQVPGLGRGTAKAPAQWFPLPETLGPC